MVRWAFPSVPLVAVGPLVAIAPARVVFVGAALWEDRRLVPA
jgi:hypothetical protein